MFAAYCYGRPDLFVFALTSTFSFIILLGEWSFVFPVVSVIHLNTQDTFVLTVSQRLRYLKPLTGKDLKKRWYALDPFMESAHFFPLTAFITSVYGLQLQC